MRHQILVDMDGVLADVYTHFINLEYKDSGKTFTQEDLRGRLEDFVFPSFQKLVNSVGFFRTVPLLPDSVEGLKYLNDKYEVLIVSSATEFPNSLTDKRYWLAEHFSFISWKQMIFCGSKCNIKGDVMIDDHPKNLSLFDGKRILFSQPHNVYVHDETYQRISGWKDIMNLL